MAHWKGREKNWKRKAHADSILKRCRLITKLIWESQKSTLFFSNKIKEK